MIKHITEYSAEIYKNKLYISAQGEFATGGYSFSTKEHEENNTLHVEIILNTPSRGSAVTQAFTYPELHETIDVSYNCKHVKVTAHKGLSPKATTIAEFDIG
jgi:hypothetical protein